MLCWGLSILLCSLTRAGVDSRARASLISTNQMILRSATHRIRPNTAYKRFHQRVPKPGERLTDETKRLAETRILHCRDGFVG